VVSQPFSSPPRPHPGFFFGRGGQPLKKFCGMRRLAGLRLPTPIWRARWTIAIRSRKRNGLWDNYSTRCRRHKINDPAAQWRSTRSLSNLHKVSLTLDMLPIVLTEDSLHSSSEWSFCSTYHGVRAESASVLWPIVGGSKMSGGLERRVPRNALNLLGHLSLNLNQWTGLIREVRSRLPAVRRPEFGA
jgi:hypothetical protein